MRSQYNNELDDIREAIAKTFTGTYGEKVLQFLEDTYMNQLSAEPNDPYSTYFNEGGRGLVLGLTAGRSSNLITRSYNVRRNRGRDKRQPH